MDYSLKEVAGRIKDLREAKGYTTEQLAKGYGYIIPEAGVCFGDVVKFKTIYGDAEANKDDVLLEKCLC